MKSSPSAVGNLVTTTIGIDGVELKISKESKRTNPLVHFQSIRMIAKMNKESITMTGGSRN
ncbi:hypothetical protein CN316_22135 [Bacillus cereus]|nr:hypothetical protein CN316_22135 [Bacillus cereus]